MINILVTNHIYDNKCYLYLPKINIGKVYSPQMYEVVKNCLNNLGTHRNYYKNSILKFLKHNNHSDFETETLSSLSQASTSHCNLSLQFNFKMLMISLGIVVLNDLLLGFGLITLLFNSIIFIVPFLFFLIFIYTNISLHLFIYLPINRLKID